MCNGELGNSLEKIDLYTGVSNGFYHSKNKVKKNIIRQVEMMSSEKGFCSVGHSHQGEENLQIGKTLINYTSKGVVNIQGI